MSRRDQWRTDGATPAPVVVADAPAAIAFAVELLRNRALARPGRRLAYSEGPLAAAVIREVRRATAVGRFPSDRLELRTTPGLPSTGADLWLDDLGVQGADETAAAGASERVLLLAGDAAPRGRLAAAARAPASGEATLVVDRRAAAAIGLATHAHGIAVIVAGTGTVCDGRHVLGASSFCRLEAAAELARDDRTVAVIFSGFDGWRGGDSEARMLRKAWRGRTDIPLILDEAARSTAENAICTLPLIRAMGGVDVVHVPTSWWNSWRVWLFFTRACGRAPRCRVDLVWRGGPHIQMAWAALTGLPALRRHWRQGVAFLLRGPEEPAARPRGWPPPPRAVR